eukprot:1549057-Rhodomonas_salina.1
MAALPPQTAQLPLESARKRKHREKREKKNGRSRYKLPTDRALLYLGSGGRGRPGRFWRSYRRGAAQVGQGT